VVKNEDVSKTTCSKMDYFRKPPVLKIKNEENIQWGKWKSQFNNYMEATGLADKADGRKIAILINLIGEDAQEVFDNFTFEKEGEEKKYSTVLAKFEEFCEPLKNPVVERYNFFEVKQKVGEPFDTFVGRLQTAARSCEFGEQHDWLVRDRIVHCIADDRIRAKLLRTQSNITLQQAMAMCRSEELCKKHISAMQTQEQVIVVDAVNKKPLSKKSEEPRRRQKADEACNNCGRVHDFGACPAKGRQCYKCQGWNHFKMMCKNKKTMTKSEGYDRRVREVQETEGCAESDEEDSEKFFVSEVNMVKAGIKSWYSDLEIAGSKVRFKLDTGSEVNILPIGTVEQLKWRPEIKKCNTVLVAYGDHKVKVAGKVKQKCRLSNGQTSNLEFVVSNVNSYPLLGLSGCLSLNLIKKVELIVGRQTKTELIEEYKEVFRGVGRIPGLHHITVDPNVTPVIHAPRKVPYGLQPKLKETLDRLEKDQIVSKVDHPTNWVNSLVIVEKKNGKLRLCLDPTDLNVAIKRAHHVTTTTEDVAVQLAGKTVFSTLDMQDGFWQIKLDEESADLCCFHTPFGRYRFNRLPFGTKQSPEVFAKKIWSIFGDIPGVQIVCDDLIIAGASADEHDETLRKVLERAKKFNIRFNPEKFQHRVDRIRYLGHEITKEGLRPDLNRVRAIVKMPEPTNKEELRRFLGMVTYVGSFLPKLSETTASLRELLKKEATWGWEMTHKQAIAKLKRQLCEAPILRFFDINKPLTIQTDASKDGLGSCLLQEGHPVAYASRSLTDAEKRYAQIEKEMLAIVFALEKFHQYVYHTRVQVHSDHKPLEVIMKKEISKVPSRLQRMLLKCYRYDLVVKYVPGKEMFLADALSRAFLDDPVQDDPEMESIVHSVACHLAVSEEKKKETQEAMRRDPVLQQVKHFHVHGWPKNIKDVKEEVRMFWKIRHDISTAEDLLFIGDKLLVPLEMRKKMLSALHEGHPGIVRCKSRARGILYWPGMSQQIEDYVARCEVCEKFQRSNAKEPMVCREIPKRPFERVAADYLEFQGLNYLVVVDSYSHWMELVKTGGKTARETIIALKAIFARNGIPETFMSDNMPFSSFEFREFAKEWDFTIVTSSPTYARSNGLAERAVQTAKMMLKKACEDQTDWNYALLQYRNTPIQSVNKSPAQLLQSRQLRCKIPATDKMLTPRVERNVRPGLLRNQTIQKHYYDRGAKELPPLQEGEDVLIKNRGTWEKAIVEYKHSSPRSYVVNSGNQYYRRNRVDLRQSHNPPQDPDHLKEKVQGDQETSATPSVGQSPTIHPSSTNNPSPESPITSRPKRQTQVPGKYKDFILSS
jgi:hypothetical protein